MVAAAMTALIPGAGPPPTRIASVFMTLCPCYPRGQRAAPASASTFGIHALLAYLAEAGREVRISVGGAGPAS